MLRGPIAPALTGQCVECGKPFPYPTGVAIFEAVKREMEHPTPPPERSGKGPGISEPGGRFPRSVP
jgi:hypothetical protein